MKQSKLFTIPEFAAALGLKPSTVRAWILHRRLNYLKIGRLVRLEQEELDRVIRSGRIRASAPEAHARQEADIMAEKSIAKT